MRSAAPRLRSIQGSSSGIAQRKRSAATCSEERSAAKRMTLWLMAMQKAPAAIAAAPSSGAGRPARKRRRPDGVALMPRPPS